MLIQRIAYVTAFGIAMTPVGAAMSQEACVVCTGPGATYRCSIEKQEKLSRIGAPGDKAIQAVCAQEMARQGGHEKCTVRRDAASADCQGVVVEIPLASLIDAIPVPEATPTPAAAAPGAIAPQKPAVAGEAPPRTMLELAERTGETSKKQLKKVGAGVGDVADRTWTCIASLFKKC